MSAPIRNPRFTAPILPDSGMMTSGERRTSPWLQNLIKLEGCWQTRDGFGQLTQLTVDSQEDTSAFGIIKHLGSKSILTDAGHTQILTGLLIQYNTGALTDLYAPFGNPKGFAYAVAIYDVDDDLYALQVLQSHTSTQGGLNLKKIPSNLTSMDKDYRGALGVDTSKTGDFIFIDGLVGDSVCVLHPDAGWWSYQPTILSKQRPSTQVPNHRHDKISPGIGESSFLIPIPAVPAPTSASPTSYLNATQRPQGVRAATQLQGMLVYCGTDGRLIYFSNPNAPQTTSVESYIVSPTDQPVTALSYVGESILIFSAKELWLYRPSAGDLVSGGMLTNLSTSIGTYSQASVVQTPTGVFWVDGNNAYFTNGSGITPIGDSIKHLFQEDIATPVNNYFTTLGLPPTSPTLPLPRLTYKMASDARCAYWPYAQAVLVSLPSQNATLVLQTGWHMWTYESLANNTNTISARQAFTSPTLVPTQDRLFMVSGPDNDPIVDAITTRTNLIRSLVIAEYGRGGALDRSCLPTEDAREGISIWSQPRHLDHISPAFYLELEPAPHGWSYNPESANVAPVGDATISTDWYFLNIYLQAGYERGNVANLWAGLDEWCLDFSFNLAQWQPLVAIPGQALLALRFDADNSGNNQAFNSTLPGAIGFAHTVDGTPVPTVGTNRIRLTYIQSQSNHANFSATVSGQSGDEYVKMVSLVFKRTRATSQVGLGLTVNAAWVHEPAPSLVEAEVFIHQVLKLGTPVQPSDALKAQCVDWAFCSSQVGFDQKYELLARGVSLSLITHGKGSSPLFPVWKYGLLNSLFASDGKDWSSQVVDTTDPVPDLILTTKVPIRTRVLNSASPPALVTKTFDGTLLWGSNTNSAHGNYLTDSEELDEIRMSMSGKGEYGSFQLFGFTMTAAEKLRFVRVESEWIITGSRRRVGRGV